MQTSLWYDNYQGAVYPLNLNAEPALGCHRKKRIKTLLSLCCQYIVRDSTMTDQTVQIIPKELYVPLMQEALLDNRDRSMEVLLSHWPWQTLAVHKLVPNLFTSLLPLYDSNYLSDIVKQSLRYTTCLPHTFLECLKKRMPTKLRFLDMSGYPTAEVILFYLATHCMLAHNEARQNAMVEVYNRAIQLLPDLEQDTPFSAVESDNSFPDSTFVIKLDAFVTSDQTHAELCKALKVSSFKESRVRLCIKKLDATCLGEPKLSIMLKQTDPLQLTGLRLKYNSLSCDDFLKLEPEIRKFTNLTALDLSCNTLSLYQRDFVCDVMAETLSTLPHLLRLDLSNNRLKTRLRRILYRINQPLQYLRLVACGLTITDIAYLSVSHHTSGLCEIDLSENNLSTSGRNLCQLFRSAGPTLIVVQLEECCLKDEHILLMLNTGCLSCLQSLLYFNIAENSFTLNALLSLTQCFSKVSVFKTFRVSYSKECYLMESESEDEISMKKMQTIVDMHQLVDQHRPSDLTKIKLIVVELDRVSYDAL